MDKITKSIDNENNLAFFRFNDNDYEISEEFTTTNGQDFVVDLDTDGKICGIEIFDYCAEKKIKKKKKVSAKTTRPRKVIKDFGGGPSILRRKKK